MVSGRPDLSLTSNHEEVGICTAVKETHIVVAAATDTPTSAGADTTRAGTKIIVAVKGKNQDTISITTTTRASTDIITVSIGKSTVSIGALLHERNGLPGWKHI